MERCSAAIQVSRWRTRLQGGRRPDTAEFWASSAGTCLALNEDAPLDRSGVSDTTRIGNGHDAIAEEME